MVAEYKTCYRLHCDHCQWKKITDSMDDFSDLFEIPGCTHCSGRKFRCPGCGFAIKLRKFVVPLPDDKNEKS